jgi:hypothetical protein
LCHNNSDWKPADFAISLEQVDIREYEKYTFEAESEAVASEWTVALLDEFGEQERTEDDELAAADGVSIEVSDSLDGPTEQADDLRESRDS